MIKQKLIIKRNGKFKEKLLIQCVWIESDLKQNTIVVNRNTRLGLQNSEETNGLEVALTRRDGPSTCVSIN